MNKAKEYIGNVSDVTKLVFLLGTPLVGLIVQVQVLSYKVDSMVAIRRENIVTMQSDKSSLLAKIDECCATANTVRTRLDSYILYNK